MLTKKFCLKCGLVEMSLMNIYGSVQNVLIATKRKPTLLDMLKQNMCPVPFCVLSAARVIIVETV